jgi:K+-transporting ATPase KdpF subunit
MTAEHWTLIVVTAALCAYLVYALVAAERM